MSTESQDSETNKSISISVIPAYEAEDMLSDAQLNTMINNYIAQCEETPTDDCMRTIPILVGAQAQIQKNREKHRSIREVFGCFACILFVFVMSLPVILDIIY